jgi:hypothetical protein
VETHRLSESLSGRLLSARAYVSLARFDEVDFGALWAMLLGCPLIASPGHVLADVLDSSSGFPVPWCSAPREMPWLEHPILALAPDLEAMEELVSFVAREPDSAISRAAEGRRLAKERFTALDRYRRVGEELATALAGDAR